MRLLRRMWNAGPGRPLAVDRVHSAILRVRLAGGWIQLDWQEPGPRPARRDEFRDVAMGFDSPKARAALELLEPWRSELEMLPLSLSLGGYFGPADAAFYYALIRQRRPQRVIEAGCGASTRVALRALLKNGTGSLVCIDPAPRWVLPFGVEHRREKLEHTPLSLFRSLDPRDVVFIDSSHGPPETGSRPALLDALPPRVLVHHHDINYPLPPQDATWDEDVVLLRYLTAHAESWSVLVFGSLLSLDYVNELRRRIPAYRHTPKRFYNGFWMEKLA